MYFRMMLLFTFIFSLNFNDANAGKIAKIVEDFNEDKTTTIKFNNGVLPTSCNHKFDGYNDNAIEALTTGSKIAVPNSGKASTYYADPVIENWRIRPDWPVSHGNERFYNGSILITELSPDSLSSGAFIFSSIKSAEINHTIGKTRDAEGDAEKLEYAKKQETKEHFNMCLFSLLDKTLDLKPTLIVTSYKKIDNPAKEFYTNYRNNYEMESSIKESLEKHGFSVPLDFDGNKFLTRPSDVQKIFIK